MARALRIAVLLLVLVGALPYPIAAAGPLDVSFEVVRETPVSVTIRATISGSSDPLDVTCRVDALERTGGAAPTVRAVQVDRVERVAAYRDTPEYETKRIPIAEAIAAKEAEIAALKNTKGLTSEEIDKRREERHDKETELAALTAQEVCGATHVEETQVVAHRYTLEMRERLVRHAACNEGDTITLPPQAARESPVGSLIAETELSLDPTVVNWGDGTRVYEYTIQTDELRDADGWGSSGILVLTVNGQDYYDDTHSSWWDSSWPYRMKLTIDNSASAEDLTDFPLMVKLTPDRFDYSWCQWDGDDIRFVDSDGTALDYELDTWDRDGESFFWVRVPHIPAGATDDYVWMYFGEPTVANGEDAEGTWNSGYAAVYHMNDKPGDATMILDSTVNALHGTKSNAASITEIAGSVGKAQAFNGDGSYITAALPVIGTGDYTVFAFTRSPAWIERNAMLYSGAGGSTNKGLFGLILQQTSVYGYFCDGSANRIQLGTRNFNAVYHNNTWSTFALTLDRDVAARHYQNGAQLGADDASITAQQGNVNANGINPPRIGVRVSGAATVHHIDELRLSSVARSAEWIEAENLTLTDAMLTYGDTEGMPEAVTDEPVVPLATALLVVAVGVVAVKQNHVILYTAAFILFLFVGFAAADDSLRTGIPIIIYAGAMLYFLMLSIGRR